MFTVILIFVGILAYPFLLGPSIAFHRIKEEHRYIKKEKVHTPEPEAFLARIFIGCFILTYLSSYGFVPMGLLNLIIKIWIIVSMILLIIYPIKIALSIKSGKPISILMDYSLNSKISKIAALAFILLICLTILENLHVIPTYLW